MQGVSAPAERGWLAVSRELKGRAACSRQAASFACCMKAAHGGEAASVALSPSTHSVRLHHCPQADRPAWSQEKGGVANRFQLVWPAWPCHTAPTTFACRTQLTLSRTADISFGRHSKAIVGRWTPGCLRRGSRGQQAWRG